MYGQLCQRDFSRLSSRFEDKKSEGFYGQGDCAGHRLLLTFQKSATMNDYQEKAETV
jgi:hypothetical protein